MHRKTILTVFCLLLSLNILFIPLETRAFVTATTATTAVGAAAGWFGDGGIFATLGRDIAEYAVDQIDAMIITASKIAALLFVQKVTQAIIGDGGGGAITDWHKYLYTSPQQRAMAQMNSFFNTVSRGRLSSLNYEGVGPNYDAYLVAQSRMAIAGQPFTTNLQEFATEPKQLFAGGNMKGIMTYMQCANNVACYTMTAQAQYATELSKATTIAKNEQSNGFLPVKKNGKIIQPASIVANALTQVDQLGTQIIMNTDDSLGVTAGEMQIAAGAGINIAARAFNYMLADSQGKEDIRNSNDQFPFSLSYSLNGGVGVKAGTKGPTSSTGVGAVSGGGLQIGNTCATSGFVVDKKGVAVTVNGQKRSCVPSQTN